MKKILQSILTWILVLCLSACGITQSISSSIDNSLTSDVTSSADTSEVKDETTDEFPVQIEDDINPFSDVTAGETLFFGSYEQDGDTANGKEPIEWSVLDEDEERLLLYSKYVLDVVEFNTEWRHVKWESSTIRTWMNSTFLYDAFSEGEQLWIMNTHVVNNDTPIYGKEGGNDTIDKVFCLSINEIRKYFIFNTWDGERLSGASEDLITEATDYARQQEVYEREITTEFYEKFLVNDGYSRDCIGRTGAAYWLRCPGGENACTVGTEGGTGISYIGHSNVYTGVRPAIWVSKTEPVIDTHNETGGEASAGSAREMADVVEVLSIDATSQHEINIFLSNFGEQVYEFEHYSVDDADNLTYQLLCFVGIWCFFNKDSYIAWTEYGGDIPLARVNEVLDRFFTIQMTDAQASTIGIAADQFATYQNGKANFKYGWGQGLPYLTVVDSLSRLSDGTYLAEFRIYYFTDQESYDTGGLKHYYGLTPDEINGMNTFKAIADGQAVMVMKDYNGKSSYRLLYYDSYRYVF